MIFELPENWEQLPMREVIINGQRRKIKYDEENELIYMMDSTGKWTGERTKVKLPPEKKQESAETPQAPEDAGDEHSPANTEATESQNKVQTPAPAKKRKKKKSNLLTIIVTALVVLGLVKVFDGKNLDGTPTEYTVIVAMQDIQPGENVGGKLASVTITADEYHQYNAQASLYSADKYSTIKEYVATAYIPSKAYITYGNVGASYSPSNPWAGTQGTETVNIPIDVDIQQLADYMWGKEVTLTLTVRKVTNQESSGTNDTSENISSSSMYETTRVDTYTVPKCTIVDVLDTYKKSLYASYAALVSIPDAYRSDYLSTYYSSRRQIKADTPAYVTLAVPAEFIAIWKNISTTTSYTVDFSVTGTACITELQSTAYQSIQQIMPPLVKAWDTKLNED